MLSTFSVFTSIITRYWCAYMTISALYCVHAGLSSPTTKKVAFFVGLTDNMGPVTEHTDIVFDRVVTNVGGAYDPLTGRFTSPCNCTFQFNVIVAAQGRQKVGAIPV